MKIPIVLATTEPGVADQPRASGAALALPAQAIGAGANDLQQLGAHIAQLEGTKQNEQARDAATDRSLALAQTVETAREQLKTPAAPGNPYGVPPGEVPSQTYVYRMNRAYDEIARTAQAGVTDNRTQAYLNRSIVHLKSQALLQAQRDSWGMYRDEQQAGVPTKLQSYRSLIIGNPEFRDVLEHERDQYLRSLTPHILTESQAEQMRLAENEKTTVGLVQRVIDVDPFADIIPKYRTDMSPESSQNLMHYQESRQRMTLSAMNQLDARLEKEGERQRQEVLTDFTAEIDTTRRGGQDVKALWGKLDAMRASRSIKSAAEYEHFSKLITDAKDAPSTPDIWNDVVQRAWRENPTIGEAEVRKLMDAHRRGEPGLSIPNGQQTLAQLDAVKRRQTTESDSDESRWHTRAGEQARTAENTAMARLGITTPFQQLDDQTKKLWADFVSEFRSRVDYFVTKPGERPHGEPAHEVMIELLPKYMVAQSDATVNSYSRLTTIMDRSLVGEPPDPKTPEWLRWAEQAAKKIEAIRDVNPNLYLQQRAQLLNLNRSRTQILQQMIQQGTAPGAPSSSSGSTYKPPASHLLRPKD